MQPIFFPTPESFYQWLENNHDKETELLVGFHKKGTGLPSMTWPESVDQALCFGWIDGVRRSFDENSYTIRFTPRRARSHWSAVNIRKMQELQEKGVMRPVGLAAFAKMEDKNAKMASYEQEAVKLDAAYEEKLKANTPAWQFFQKLPPSVKKPSIWWIMSAKQEATREKRLDILIDCSAEGKKIPMLRRKGDKE